MKTSMLIIFISGCLLVSFSSCKKNKEVIDTPPNETTTGGDQSDGAGTARTNPVTASTTCDYNFNDTTLTNHGWTKTFDDHFSGDLSNWTALTGGVTNEVMCNEPANAKIVDGELQLIAIKENVTGPVTVGSTTQQSFNYTSASIISNQTFTINTTTPKLMIVARVKVAKGYGLTSVFDSFGSNWPTNGQINFFQVGGNDTQEYATNYFYGDSPLQNTVVGGMQYNPVSSDLGDCYHVFMTEWSQTSLKYYIDGTLVETKTGDVSKLFNKEHTLGISLPIGGLFYSNFVPNNIQVGTLHVSYVKAFTSK